MFFLVVITLFAFAALFQHEHQIRTMISAPRNSLILALIGIGFGLALMGFGIVRLWKVRSERIQFKEVISETQESIFCGLNSTGQEVHLKPEQREVHTQVVGTTNAGKTESIILPWAIQDIEKGRGLLIIDGKADRGLLDKLYAYTVKFGREKDFRLFSLSQIDHSSQFNPLIGGTPEEVAERVFNSFEIENSYYRAIQFEILCQVLRVFEDLKLTPTFERVYHFLSEPDRMVERQITSPWLKKWAVRFSSLSERDRLERVSGLLTAIGQFAFGRHGDLFRTDSPQLDIDEALRENKIVYFQLPVLLAPFLGRAMGKLVLQTLQAAIANRHRAGGNEQKFFSVFLDDFTEYLYPGFVSILNKSRSAKVGVVFAHQALGDIEALGTSVANSILTNSNLKVFMRGSDPDSAEYFSRVIGTRTTTKTTERAKREFLAQKVTGDASLREVEEFIIHPNRFKSALGVGEAFMVIPHRSGSRTEFTKLRMFPDLAPVELPISKIQIAGEIERILTKPKDPSVIQEVLI